MKNVSAWESVCDRKLLDFLLVRGSSRQRSLTAGLLLAGMLGAIVALAGPSWQKREIPVFTPENPVMFLLNLSSDMDETDVTPNRLARAKYAVSDLLKTLSGTESGLVVYTNEPFLISPLSEDGRVIDNLLRAVTPDIVPETATAWTGRWTMRSNGCGNPAVTRAISWCWRPTSVRISIWR